ncbi:Domain of uncharacterised function (DUF336) [Serratia entomophila]|uniref:Heme-binding protein n=1 Tax=Serratia entomophila TaxID=42906 RepID=A0ABY5CYZ4_9GAMM|nr:heme-binding protein [Serratia entomophila]UIW16245.1 heme-binding protein [Serratia entomophila]USV03177.1 heme-binding protein [Serratia entomophila]CAI0709774.1 Domain of uncharacterised function (DUF336) [Serratia entomophila]CAI0800301.1 Domain of uncharacterised function (DUF336) [Serratia entomophila]CAI0810684.1 Domain of uncharacterised function (DUF336) [Serratia entomophila]
MSGSFSLEYAQQIIAKGIAAAQRLKVCVCISVFDDGANMIAFARMNNTPLGAIDLAQRKAKTSALFRIPSGDLGRLSGTGQELWSIEHSNNGLASFAGGLPVYLPDGDFIGAIGISGAKSHEDADIADACLK